MRTALPTLSLPSLICSVVMIFSLTTSASAQALQPFSAINRHHIDYGISQLWAGNAPTPDRSRFQVSLMNPTQVDHVFAVLYYESPRSDGSGFGGESEDYDNCAVGVITPHGSLSIEDDEIPGDLSDVSLYLEVISVPKRLIFDGQKETRLLNGAGLIVDTRRKGHDAFPVHPKLFSLPVDDEGDGNQRLNAQCCICNQLESIKLEQISNSVPQDDQVSRRSFEEITDGFDCRDILPLCV